MYSEVRNIENHPPKSREGEAANSMEGDRAKDRREQGRSPAHEDGRLRRLPGRQTDQRIKCGGAKPSPAQRPKGGPACPGAHHPRPLEDALKRIRIIVRITTSYVQFGFNGRALDKFFNH